MSLVTSLTNYFEFDTTESYVEFCVDGLEYLMHLFAKLFNSNVVQDKTKLSYDSFLCQLVLQL